MIWEIMETRRETTNKKGKLEKHGKPIKTSPLTVNTLIFSLNETSNPKQPFPKQEKTSYTIKKREPPKIPPLNKKTLKNTLNKKSNPLITVPTLGKKRGIRQKTWETPKNNHFSKNCAKNQPNNKQKHAHPPYNARFYKN